jgi:hypothetical protein
VRRIYTDVVTPAGSLNVGGTGYNVMLVKRNEEVSDIDEAWVYLTAAVIALQKEISAISFMAAAA